MGVSLVDRHQRSQDYEADETISANWPCLYCPVWMPAGFRCDKQIKDKLFGLQLPAALHKHAAM